MNAKDILETEIPNLLKSKPEVAKDVNAVIHFNVTGDNGGTWTLDCTKAADCTGVCANKQCPWGSACTTSADCAASARRTAVASIR